VVVSGCAWLGQARKAEAPEGSYTKRLFNDPELLRNKLLEEAQVALTLCHPEDSRVVILGPDDLDGSLLQELIEAETQDHVAAEAADLLYFALVR
jgi:phosphoribosyl-ATP pyrophosphohydrolase